MKRESSRETILAAAQDAIRELGARRVTVDGVARRAGCAKGLVHYHFKTKRGLFEGVAEHLASARRLRWEQVLASDTPEEAIKESWTLLTEESKDGTIRAWASLFVSGGVLPDPTVRNVLSEFSQALGRGIEQLFGRTGLMPTVPAGEIGWLLGAVIHGVGLQLDGGAARQDLEGAFAAAWLGILSLFR
jgi:AcrR family transcriptional regulator